MTALEAKSGRSRIPHHSVGAGRDPARGCVNVPIFEGETEEEALAAAGLSREDAETYDLAIFIRRFFVTRDGRDMGRN